MRRFLLHSLLLLGSLSILWAKSPSIDSLEKQLKTTKQDMQRSRILSELTWKLRDTDLKKALQFSLENLALAEEKNLEAQKPQVYNYVGIIYRNMGNYTQSLKFYKKALLKATELKIPIQEAYSYNNIGEIFMLQSDVQNAKRNIEKAIDMFRRLKSKRGEAYGYLRMGEIYEQQKKYDSALIAFTQVEEIRNKMANKYAVEVAWHRIGVLYANQGKYEEALKYVNRALRIYKEDNNIRGVNSLRNTKAEIYLKLKKTTEAIKLASQSLKETTQMDAKPLMYQSAQILHLAFAELGEYEKAYDYQQKYIATLELFLNERNRNHMNAMNFSYELAKKQEELERIQEQNRLKQGLVSTLMVALLLLVILMMVLYRSFWRKQRANTLLQAKNLVIEQKNEALISSEEEIRSQRDAIEVQNHHITKSIKVAKTIQEAILPNQESLKQMFAEYFVIYRPRDVVSGDFYWVGNVDNKKIVAAIDCTGHGVPGAFMSMISFALINETVNTRQISRPEEALEQLRIDLRNALRQEITHNREGMDMAFVTIEPLENEQFQVEFAGAKRPLWYIEKGSPEIQKIDGSRLTIGITYQEKKSIAAQSFTCSKGTMFYIGSDGFADQNNYQRKS